MAHFESLYLHEKCVELNVTELSLPFGSNMLCKNIPLDVTGSFQLASYRKLVKKKEVIPDITALCGGIFKGRHVFLTGYSFRGVTEQI